MCAKFSPDGSKIFCLGRRLNPVLYDISSPIAMAEFDHPGYFNSCTMKSGCFGHGYVFSGSDDFNVYGWKIPEFDKQDSKITLMIKRADFVLKGHRSIVNQVRYFF
jgi:WD repeat-containing protein 22